MGEGGIYMPVHLPPAPPTTKQIRNKTKYKQFSVCQKILPQSNYWALVCPSYPPLSSLKHTAPFPTHRGTDVTRHLDHSTGFPFQLTASDIHQQLDLEGWGPPPWIQPPVDLYKLTTLCHYLHILLGYLYTQFLLLLLLAVLGLCCYARAFSCSANGGHSLFALWGLLIVGAPPVVYRFSGEWVVVARGLSIVAAWA